jgi:hypothetical protein
MSNKNVVGHPAPQASEGLVSEKQLSKAFVATVDLAQDKPPARKAASTHSQTLEPPGGALFSGDVFPEGAWFTGGTGELRRRRNRTHLAQRRAPAKEPSLTLDMFRQQPLLYRVKNLVGSEVGLVQVGLALPSDGLGPDSRYSLLERLIHPS